MLRTLLYRPVAVLMTTFGLCVLGIVVLRTLPIGLLPDIAIPRVTVQISWPDRSAREIEDAVVQPLRNRLLQLNRLEDIRSESRNGSADIQLSFTYGTQTDLAFIEANEQIDQVTSYLPRELARPRVLKANVSDLPVFYLSVVPKASAAGGGAADLLDLSEFARSVLKRRIEQLPAVAFVDLSGLAVPEIRILPRQQQLRSLGLTNEDIRRALEENNVQLGSILLQDEQYQYAIRFSSRLESVEDIGGIYLRVGERSLRLAEIAEIGLYARPARGQYRFQDRNDAAPGRHGIAMSIRKQADARLFDLQTSFEALFAALQTEYPQLDFYVTNDQSHLLRVSIDNLLTSLLYGAGFAFIVLLLFFREWRAPVLISLVIPVALIMAMFGLYLADISINIISLAGLILGVGLMIDNSIIVIENIRQHRGMGLPLNEACIRGGEEVIRPLLSSALTTCSVFLPLIFLSGLAGALFYDQAVSITIALGASLLVAYLLLPVLVYLLARRRDPGPAATGVASGDWLQKASRGPYARSVDVVLGRRYIFLLLIALLLGAAYWQLQRSERAVFPDLTRPALEARIDWNASISLEANEQRLGTLLHDLQPYIDSAQLFIGEQQFLLADWEQRINEARLHVFPASGISIDTMGRHMQAWIDRQYPEAVIRTAPVKNLFDQVFAQEAPPLVLHLQSVNSAQTPEPAAVGPIVQALRERGLSPQLPARQEQYVIRVRRNDAMRYGVPYTTLYDRLRTLFNENQINALQTGDQSVPIVLGEQSQTFFHILNQSTVLNRQGNVLPLDRFIETEREEAYKSLQATRSGEAYEIALGWYSPQLEEEIRALVSQHPQLTVRFSGAAYDSRRQVRELLIVLAIALMLLYLILAAQFESLLQPLIVMLTVPVGIAGAIFVLYWSGQSLNLISIIGMTVMSGIVVNDAILKVDMMNRLRREGADLTTAIHGAGYRRLRPILMTSLTTMLALAPVLFSGGLGAELQRPLAWAVIGGLTFGTAASLYLLPVLYALLPASLDQRK